MPAAYQRLMTSGRSLNDLWRCNMGGPMSRRETQRFSGSLLGQAVTDGGAKLSPAMSIGLHFDLEEDPVQATYAILERAGLTTAEELRKLVSFPLQSMICVPATMVIPISRSNELLIDLPFLSSAFILGLCTATFYDPLRPVIWTHASLTRTVRLYNLGGFYATA